MQQKIYQKAKDIDSGQPAQNVQVGLNRYLLYMDPYHRAHFHTSYILHVIKKDNKLFYHTRVAVCSGTQ